MLYTALIIGESAPTREGVAACLKDTALFRRKLYCVDARRAIRWLQGHTIDMICCDWRPENRTEVVQLLAVLRRRTEWMDLPVVLFTAGDDRQLWLEGMELGVCDCLSRTAPEEELQVKLRWHLKNRERIQSLHQSQSKLARMALSDGLTGLFNRAYFDATMQQEVARCVRTGKPLSLLMVALDHFQRINDTHGHLAGDKVLEKVAEVLTACSRTSDTVCRFGGEEFALILPETPLKSACVVAERIREAINEMHIGFPVTVSIGVGSAKGYKSLLPEHLIAEADAALYEAKRRGRNRSEASLFSQGLMPDLSFFRRFNPAAASA